MASILSFPQLQVVSINDFTPGLYTGSTSTAVYSSTAQPGSASQSFRCYARPGIGLCPLPSYSTLTTKTYASGASTGYLMMADMKVYTGTNSFYGPAQPQDSLVVTWTKLNRATTTQTFDLDDVLSGVIGNLYTHTNTTSNIFEPWPNLTKTFWNQSSKLSFGVVSMDPTLTVSGSAAAWVAYPNPTAGTGTTTGSMAAGTAFVKTAYFGGRTVFFSQPAAIFGVATDMDAIFTSDIQALTNITTSPEFSEPELATLIQSWGSISTGEFIVFYGSGGATVYYGDLQFPSSAIFLPGVTGPGYCNCPALSTPNGLVYVTDSAGVWLWNGGNTSQKISTQLPDNAFLRAIPGLSTDFVPSFVGQSNMGQWANWSFFPNNLMWDADTGGWWQIEDPGVANFQVFGGQGGSVQFFYASVANAYSATGGTLSVPISVFNRQAPQSSYSWTSTPIPNPGSDVTLGAVEICASNTTATTATVTITPTDPPGQTLYPNNNPNQNAVFTIPPHTSSFRKALALGWNDYNMCIKAVAANSNNSNSAPFIHEINLGFTAINS